MSRPIRSNPPTGAPTALAFAFGILLVTLCAASPACATLYKWTDASGVVVYSDQPPPGNVKFETISGPPPPADPNAAKDLANKELEQKKKQTTTADTAKKAAQQRADADRLAGSCRDARAELASLTADQILLYTINEKGEQVMMNDGDRKKRRATVDSYLKANCPPR